MPVAYRKWFIQRIADEYSDQADARKRQSDNTSRRNVRDLPMGEMGLEAASSPPKDGPKSFK